MRRAIATLAICVAAATARADDWGVHRDPFDPVLVQRYKSVLARDPYDDGILRQLVALYQRHRTIAALEAEYRAAGDDWASLVVLARLPRASRADAAALWSRAIALRPDDARGWLADGDAAIEPATARDAYRRAVQLLTEPRQKRAALVKLVGAAQRAGDDDGVDRAYAGLIALAPGDGGLWLDRGSAQLGAKRFAPALDSFAAAEPLLRTDPERQLTAITDHAIALEALGRTDAAIADYERALAKAPDGYALRGDLVLHIIEADRRRGALAGAIARLEQRWPERTRGYFEHATLADLYHETHDDERAIAAYRSAVAKAPTEIATQRKLIALLDKLHPSEALAQHEAAARIAPGDADLQLELAKRYYPDHTAKGLATLGRLAQRMSINVGVREAIARLYEQWKEPGRAIGEYEAIAAIEPNEPDHAIVLGEAYWRANQGAKARAAWLRLDKIGTPIALYRHGETLAMHEEWAAAVTEYTKSLALDGAHADAWSGRARAYAELTRWADAVEDARRAVALTAASTEIAGRSNRSLLVRMLPQTGTATLAATLERWRFAFDHGDAAAGYLLAAHHARIGSPQLHAVLEQLYRRVPTDDSLGFALARSYVHRGEWAHARDELARIARRSPARAQEVADMIAEVDREHDRREVALRWEEEGAAPRHGPPDLAGRDHRFGMRLELGGEVRRASSALLGFGMYESFRIATGTAAYWRLDWTKRDADMAELDAVALGGNLATRLVDARKLELAVGVGARVELRYGNGDFDRFALAGDVTLEMLPRAIPATVGLRFDHNATDATKASALLLELGFEAR